MAEIISKKETYKGINFRVRDKQIRVDLENTRMSVWFIASLLYELEDLQLFASTVSPTEPLDIKTTAEILAKAQLELRDYHNNR
jgi:hypothetical protein